MVEEEWRGIGRREGRATCVVDGEASLRGQAGGGAGGFYSFGCGGWVDAAYKVRTN